MADILDELYDDFALAVMVITDKLRVEGSAFITDLDLDESLADGIAATVAQELAIVTRGKHVSKPNMVAAMQKYQSRYTSIVTWVSGRRIVPTVLACEVDGLDGVWYFYIERDEDD